MRTMTADTIVTPVQTVEHGASSSRSDLLAIEDHCSFIWTAFRSRLRAYPGLRSRPRRRLSVYEGIVEDLS